jgi:putative DNA primase/helicase
MITADIIRKALQCDNLSCECHKANGKVHCPTPSHIDLHPSFSVDSGRNGKVLVKCQSQCRDNQDLPINALKSKGLWPSSNWEGKPKLNIIKTYDYQDPTGKMVYQVCRTDAKEFPQRRPDPAQPGKWIWKMAGVTRYPYRLPQVLKADTVFVVEGEKDADNLAEQGLTGTTNPGGASKPGERQKWLPEFNQYFEGKSVVIFPDNDPPGTAHALDVARHLHGVAASVKVVELPNLPEKGDVSDWLNGGGTMEQLVALVEAAPEYDQAQEPEAEIPAPEDDGKKPTQAEILISLASHGEFFHDYHKLGLLTLLDGDHATYLIRSTDFRLWLRRAYFQQTGKAPNAQALSDALGVLEARALFDGPTLPVFVRVGEHDGKVYLDLGDPTWRAVEVDAQGWRVVTTPPVKFVRKPGMLPLPIPHPEGTIDKMRPFLNLPGGSAGEKAWRLIVSWLVKACRPTGPYPILAIHGPQGCAKTTMGRMLRSLVDPSSSPLRAEPKEQRDLVISAKNGWCVAFDNLNSLPQWLSDGLCRLATGGGFATRALYTDDEEALFEAMRPVILTGINPVAASQDLIDRQVLVELQDFGSDAERQEEAVIWRQFGEARPHILAGLLTGVSMALRRMRTLKISRLPRMADFAKWATAAEAAWGWPDGAFLEAYADNRAGQASASVEADLVASTLVEFMQEREFWEGTPTELHEAMTTLVPEEKRKLKVGKSYAWPQATNILTRRLRKAQMFLKQFGLRITDAHSGDRTIRIDKCGENAVQSVHAVQEQELCGLSLDDTLDDIKGLDDTQKIPSTRKATDDNELGDTDGEDDKNRSISNETLVNCGNCQNFTASLGAPGGRGHCSKKSWNGKSTQFSGDPHPCQSFEALAACDKGVGQVMEKVVQSLNSEEDLKEVVIT